MFPRVFLDENQQILSVDLSSLATALLSGPKRLNPVSRISILRIGVRPPPSHGMAVVNRAELNRAVSKAFREGFDFFTEHIETDGLAHFPSDGLESTPTSICLSVCSSPPRHAVGKKSQSGKEAESRYIKSKSEAASNNKHCNKVRDGGERSRPALSLVRFVSLPAVRRPGLRREI